MAGYETNVKLNVDTTQLDEVIEKAKQLKETLWVVNGLMEELAGANNANVTAELSMDRKFAEHELRHSQLAKEFEEMDARVKGRLNRIRY